jgi:hypothetical protein
MRAMEYRTYPPPKVGDEFNHLTVVCVMARTRTLCRCRCGELTEAGLSLLHKGLKKSCGCTNPGSTKHGMSDTPEFHTYMTMRARCYRSNMKQYANYGGRGIKVCDRWLASFESFYEDMGPRPTARHSLDRIDVNGDYEPGNVRWATDDVQARNKRDNRLITAFGRTQCITDWANECGLSSGVIASRIKRGWAISVAVSTPSTKASGMSARPIEIDGVAHTAAEWAAIAGVSDTTIYKRLKKWGPVPAVYGGKVYPLNG